MAAQPSLSKIIETTHGAGCGLHIEEDGDFEDVEGDEGGEDRPEGGSTKAAEGLQAALKAERAARQAAEAKAAALTAAQEEAARRAAEEAGEYKRLYEDLNGKHAAAAEKLTALEAKEAARAEAMKARNAKRIEALPESYRAIIVATLDPDTVADQLTAVEALASADATRPAGTRANPRTADLNKPPPVILAEIAAEAARHGKTPEQWFPLWSKTKAGKARLSKLTSST